MPALDSAPYLKPCPFCGCDLESKWNRPNPSAKCTTPDCMGSKLPSLCLDVPEHVEAWNTRAVFASLVAPVDELGAEACMKPLVNFGKNYQAQVITVSQHPEDLDRLTKTNA